MRIKLAVSVAVLLASGVLFAEQKPAPKTDVAADPVVMTFGAQTIRQSEFEAAVKSLPDEYKAMVTGPGKREFAEDYLRMKILAVEAEKSGLEKSPDVIAQIRLLRDNALAQAQLAKITESIKLSDEEIQKVYDEKKPQFEQSSARHILIAFQGSPAARPEKPELTEEQAKAKAEELRKKIVAGADFAEVAKAESDDTGSAALGGDLGSFPRGRMFPEFDKAAFESKIGEVSEVIRTQFGYHIIQVQERKVTPLAEVKEELERDLKQKRVADAIDALKTASKPTFSEFFFAPPAAAAEATEPGVPKKP